MEITKSAEQYKKTVKRYQSNRETYELEMPSGAVFEVVKLTMMEGLAVFQLLPAKMADIYGKSEEHKVNMNYLLHDNLQNILDALLPDFVRTPTIVKKDDTSGQLRTDELATRDQWTLLEEILSQAIGGGAAKEAETFQEGPESPASSQDVPTT